MSFVDKIVSEKGDLVHKVVATDDTGRRAFYFVRVAPMKEGAFVRAVEAGSLDLAEYGEVIASCYGEEPTEEVRTLLREKYGFNV